MAHIHLEDGAFTLFWVAVWTLAAMGPVLLALYRVGGKRIPTSKLAIASMCVAVGFAVFQVEIPLFGGLHLNLTPLFGILIGPALGSLSVLMINIFGSAIGHGGWGMIGANTLVNVVEVVLGYGFYVVLRTKLHASRFASGFGATSAALAISSFLIVAIVAISEIQDSTQTRAQTIDNMTIIALVNVITGIIEGVVTGYIVAFLGKVRPDLLWGAEGKNPKEEKPSSGEAIAGV